MQNSFVFVIILFCFYMVDTFAMSPSPHRGGEVGILIKDDLPCFYLSDSQNIGRYSLKGKEKTNRGNFEWEYNNNFEQRKIVENSCILWKSLEFLEKPDFLFNIPYEVTISTISNSYSSDFCLTQRNGVPILQKVRGTECYDPPKSKWQSFKGLFH